MPRKKKPENLEIVPAPEATKSLVRFDGSLDGMAKLARIDDETLPEARSRIVEMLRGEVDMTKLVAAFDKLSRKGHVASLDEVAQKSGLNRSVVVGAIARVMHAWNYDVAKVAVTAVCARRAASVGEALADSASSLAEGSDRDRRLFMEASGVIAQRGVPMQVNVRAEANNNSTRVDQANVAFVGRELPSFEEGTKRMAAALRVIPVTAEVE